MKSSFFKLCFVTVIVGFISIKANAQLGFCSGNSGDPIFTEDFGVAPSSATEHISIPAPGTTTYGFLGNPPAVFADGLYTVSNMNYQQWNWFNQGDHTQGDVNGRMLVVNASFTPGEFYRLPISGLCENTTYEFSSWVMNLTPRDLLNNGATPNPCNVMFEIWDSTNTTILKSGSTGDFFGSLSTELGVWVENALVFKTLSGQTDVILKMVNNGTGGYGNDLAIDDITFKSCGDAIATEDMDDNSSISICSNQTYSGTMTAIPDGSVFGSILFYKWQESTNGVIWTDIVGATNQQLTVSNITPPMSYRAKVAEDISNIDNPQCHTFSDVFQISEVPNPAPPVSSGDVDFNCSTSLTQLAVTVPNGVSVNWYDSAVGGILLQSDSTTYTATAVGTYYAESVISAGCISSTRTPVSTLIVYPVAPISNGDVNASCIDAPETISVTVPSGVTANWYPVANGGIPLLSGNTAFTPSTSGTYYAEAEIINTGCRSLIRTAIQVDFVETPQVEDEFLSLCSGLEKELNANVINESSINANYLWNTGETAESIIVNTAGLYTVEVTNNGFCPVIKTIDLTQAQDPVIESVKSDGADIIVTTTNSGDFLYSIDGNVFQLSNRFRNIDGGLYMVYVRSQDCSVVVSTEYLHFYIPKYFTPNNDGKNDTFDLSGIEYYASSNVSIFDRYGKLLKNSRNSPFSWNGTFKNIELPADDYWYTIIIEGQKFSGHFTLKR